MYLSRTIEKKIHELSTFFPILLLTGPRQVGKTTVLQTCAESGRTVVSLDDPDVRALARNDPGLFLQRFQPPLLVDEIQYAPQLLPYLKMIVDKNRQPGQFWLTGSQQFHLMKNVAESLAGRVGILKLAGLSLCEQQGRSNREPFLPEPEIVARRAVPGMDSPTLFHHIWKGSFPDLCSHDDSMWQAFYSSYLQTYIERDIRGLAQVGDEMRFLRFMKVLAARTGQMLNASEVARDVGASANTISNWISILQSTGLVYLLQPYFNNMTSRAIKTPKLFFMDTGLACYLTGWSNPEVLESGAMSGPMLETFVISEVIKSWWHNGREAPVFFYRNRDKQEIDLIIEENGLLYPVEIKKKSNPGPGDVRTFAVIENKLQRQAGPGAVICTAPTHLPIRRDVLAVPVSCV